MKAIVRKPVYGKDLWSDFDRFFDTFWSGSVPVRRDVPAVDIRETDDAYFIEADLPGIGEDDLDIKIDDNLLTISAERKEEKTEDDKKYLLRERKNYGIKRSFVLPKDVDVKKVEAVFKNGQLTLELKKKEAAKPLSISVKTK